MKSTEAERVGVKREKRKRKRKTEDNKPLK